MKKKICFFINSGWYFKLHWFDRAKLFLDDGFEVYVIGHFTREEKAFLTRVGMNCYESGMHERSLNVFSSLKDMLNIFLIIRKIRPDILHSITIKPILIGGIFSRLLARPFVASFVGLGRVFMKQDPLYKTLNFFVRKLYNFIFGNAKSRLIFEHDHDMNLLRSLTNISKHQCFVIDGVGVDLINNYNYIAEKNNKPPVVLFASRLLKSKGLEVLVNIKKEMLSEGIDFILNVAGIEVKDDSDAIPIERINKWHNLGLINWLGKRDDVPELIAESNIVALPSTYFEGVPRILIEGAAIGRACVVYDSGGCSSIIKDSINGYVIKKNDAEEFKEKLFLLLSDPELRCKMGTNGRKIVEERFSLQSVFNKTKLIYLNLI